MKNHFKTFWATALLITFSTAVSAQENDAASIDLGTIQPYHIKVTYDKTSHLIFPSAIRYVDLGSKHLIASKAEDVVNVLRIKASIKNFEEETNFSVITDDGRFYSFVVRYSPFPQAITFTMNSTDPESAELLKQSARFEELDDTPPAMAEKLMQGLLEKNYRTIKHIKTKSNGVEFLLKRIYICKGRYYFHIQLKNSTNVPFRTDFISFKIADRKTTRRTAVQQRNLPPLRIYSLLKEIGASSSGQNISVLDLFTISRDQVLLIEIGEIGGVRHQTLKVKSSDLLKARVLDGRQLHSSIL